MITKRTTKAAQACDNCKRSHLKCDGEIVCSRCKKLDYECNYSDSKKRGPKPASGSSSLTRRDVQQNNLQQLLFLNARLEQEIKHLQSQVAFWEAKYRLAENILIQQPPTLPPPGISQSLPYHNPLPQVPYAHQGSIPGLASHPSPYSAYTTASTSTSSVPSYPSTAHPSFSSSTALPNNQSVYSELAMAGSSLNLPMAGQPSYMPPSASSGLDFQNSSNSTTTTTSSTKAPMPLHPPARNYTNTTTSTSSGPAGSVLNKLQSEQASKWLDAFHEAVLPVFSTHFGTTNFNDLRTVFAMEESGAPLRRDFLIKKFLYSLMLAIGAKLCKNTLESRALTAEAISVLEKPHTDLLSPPSMEVCYGLLLLGQLCLFRANFSSAAHYNLLAYRLSQGLVGGADTTGPSVSAANFLRIKALTEVMALARDNVDRQHYFRKAQELNPQGLDLVHLYMHFIRSELCGFEKYQEDPTARTTQIVNYLKSCEDALNEAEIAKPLSLAEHRRHPIKLKLIHSFRMCVYAFRAVAFFQSGNRDLALQWAETVVKGTEHQHFSKYCLKAALSLGFAMMIFLKLNRRDLINQPMNILRETSETIPFASEIVNNIQNYTRRSTIIQTSDSDTSSSWILEIFDTFGVHSTVPFTSPFQSDSPPYFTGSSSLFLPEMEVDLASPCFVTPRRWDG